MLDIGWTEILILATVSLFVIGPKEIPKFLGYLGKMFAKIKGYSRRTRQAKVAYSHKTTPPPRVRSYVY